MTDGLWAVFTDTKSLSEGSELEIYLLLSVTSWDRFRVTVTPYQQHTNPTVSQPSKGLTLVSNILFRQSELLPNLE